MRKIALSIGLFVLFFIISGCAAVGIPETSDPVEKLKWADAALSSGRPLPAERLLNEAIPLLEKEKKVGMLGGAYNISGRLEYSLLRKNQNYYYAIMKFDKSLSYLEEFLNGNMLDKNDKYLSMYYQWATNSAFSLGELYQTNRNFILSCYYFDKSYVFYKELIKINNTGKINSPGFKSFEEAIDKNKKWSNCNINDSSRSISEINELITKTQKDLFDENFPKAEKKYIADSEIENYINMLSSNVIKKRIFILKTIFRAELTDNRIFTVINKNLSNKNMQKDISNIEADEISWLCKALASSGRIEYEDTLHKVYENSDDTKVKRYAKQSLNILENFEIRNRNILQQEQ